MDIQGKAAFAGSYFNYGIELLLFKECWEVIEYPVILLHGPILIHESASTVAGIRQVFNLHLESRPFRQTKSLQDDGPGARHRDNVPFHIVSFCPLS